MRFECVGKIKSILPAGKLYKIILQDLETRQNWAIYADFKAIVSIPFRDFTLFCLVYPWYF